MLYIRYTIILEKTQLWKIAIYKHWENVLKIKFVSFQYYKAAELVLCSENPDIYQLTNVIHVDGYREWFKKLIPAETKNITTCFDNSVKHSLKMLVCCKEFSEVTINSIYSIICSEEILANNNFICKILHFITRPYNMKSLFQIIEMSKFCYDMCPLDLQAKNAPPTRSLHELYKRQFDLATTFDTIKQFACRDVLDGSIVEAWGHIFKVSYDDPKKDNSDQKPNFFLLAMLIRKPSCCLLLGDL